VLKAFGQQTATRSSKMVLLDADFGSYRIKAFDSKIEEELEVFLLQKLVLRPVVLGQECMEYGTSKTLSDDAQATTTMVAWHRPML
jgi:hypothetical protein